MTLKIYKSERLAIGIVLFAVGGVGISVGMSFPLLTFLLEREGFGASLIGINSAMSSLGIFVIGLYTARVLVRHGAFLLIIAATTIGAGSLIALPLIDHAIAWFVLRFSLALGMGFIWLLSESWLNMLSSNVNRGRIIGLYAVFFSGGFALGPLIVTLTGSQGTIPFFIAATVTVVTTLPMLMLAGRGTIRGEKPTPRLAMLRLAPFIFIFAFAGGLFETTAFSLLPIYTLSTGLSETASLYALSAFSAGGIAFQYPLGRYADSSGRPAMMMLCAVGVLIGIIILPFVVGQTYLLMMLLFVWGGMIFGLYTSGLIMLGDTYKPEDLVAANALFIVCYVAGAMFGPALSGGAMDIWPRGGFVSFLMVMAAFLVGAVLVRKFRSMSPKTESQD